MIEGVGGMSEAIVGTEELTAHLSGDKQAAIDAATALVRAYCRWHVTPQITETVRVRGSGSHVLQLPSLHIETVTSVATGGETLDPAAYEVHEQGFLLRRHPWARGRIYEVRFTHGFEAAPDLAQVILKAAATAASAPMAPGPATSVSLGSARVGYGTPGGVGLGSLSSADLAVLDRYRLPRLP